MELSTEVQEGLQIAGDTSVIQDNDFITIMDVLCHNIPNLKQPHKTLDIPQKSETTVAVKRAYGSLLCLMLEAAKHDADESNIVAILEDCRFSPDRLSSVTKSFLEHKAQIRTHLGGIGLYPPHIVDVDWRLDYCIKDSNRDKVNEPVYLIDLKTQRSGETELHDIQFSCTMEQLQDLVGKLKDATKSLEKIAQL
ncbi:PREDICTED: COMM domain-containing protein 3-like [Priapulus caudatus]|uniref:COMM domain-containing protein 3 n=1 Tax=Priapulus caudatus TaxID=37621 RepID=A0ABM1EW07_PRICU|nr:PREDICTED: COMM domain-containing protein 3-like [Priapulus caudatus]